MLSTKFSQDYKHPALENHRSVWMMEHVLELRNFLYVVKADNMKYNMVSEILNAFETTVIPEYPKLDKGIIYMIACYFKK